MDAQIPESGTVNQPEEDTSGPASVINGESDNGDYEPCFLSFGNEDDGFTTNITRLRLGVAAACQKCSIVLDAITTYSSRRLPIDSITNVRVMPMHGWIGFEYQSLPDVRGVTMQSGKDDQDNEKVCSVGLQLIRLEGKLTHINMFIQ
jgi:hypothetical protein